MKLYNSIGPNPRVVRMFAAEKGITLEREEVDIVAGECRRDPYLAVNPMGSTPALALPSGQVISEIVAICEYLEEAVPEPALIGTSAEQRAETRMWARRIDLGFVDPLTLGFRAAEGRAMFAPRMRVAPEDAAPDLKGMAVDMLDTLERHVAEQDYITGDRFSLADILLFGFVAFGEQVGMSLLPERSALAAWFARIDARPSSQA